MNSFFAFSLLTSFCFHFWYRFHWSSSPFCCWVETISNFSVQLSVLEFHSISLLTSLRCVFYLHSFPLLSCFLSTESSSTNFRLTRAALHSQTSHIWRHALFFTLLHICRTFPDIEFQKECRWKSWTKMRWKMLPNNKRIEKATLDCHQMTLTTFKQQILEHEKRKRIFKFIQIPGRKIKDILCSPFFIFLQLLLLHLVRSTTFGRTGYYYRINMQQSSWRLSHGFSFFSMRDLPRNNFPSSISVCQSNRTKLLLLLLCWKRASCLPFSSWQFSFHPPPATTLPGLRMIFFSS